VTNEAGLLPRNMSFCNNLNQTKGNLWE